MRERNKVRENRERGRRKGRDWDSFLRVGQVGVFGGGGPGQTVECSRTTSNGRGTFGANASAARRMNAQSNVKSDLTHGVARTFESGAGVAAGSSSADLGHGAVRAFRAAPRRRGLRRRRTIRRAAVLLFFPSFGCARFYLFVLGLFFGNTIRVHHASFLSFFVGLLWQFENGIFPCRTVCTRIGYFNRRREVGVVVFFPFVWICLGRGRSRELLVLEVSGGREGSGDGSEKGSRLGHRHRVL